MRAGLSTIQQTLTPEAASVLNHSIAEAGRRNHGQTTPLHVAATLLAAPSGFLRQACIRSHPNSSHPLQCRALELCFSVALERLPTAQNMAAQGAEPPISNALMAALKRAQAHQRRGCPEQQHQPLLAVKVELEQLVISILDDPSVSRVMREASFSSPAVKATIEQTLNTNPHPVHHHQNQNQNHSSLVGGVGNVNLGGSFGGLSGPRMIPSPAQLSTQAVPMVNRNLYMNPRLQQGGVGPVMNPRSEEVKRVLDILTRSKKRNPILVGESEPDAVVKEFLKKLENKEIGNEGCFKNVQVISIEKEFLSDRGKIVEKIKELNKVIEDKIGNGGVILDFGDLKWLVESFGGLQQQEVVSEMGKAAVVEVGKLLTRFGDGENKLWLIGTAACDTYFRCRVYHSTMENDWDLQAVPIAAKSPLPGMFPRLGSDRILPNQVQPLNPLKSFPSPLPGLTRHVSDNSDPAQKATFCPQCSENYEKEVSRLKAIEKSFSEENRPSLPQWLQNAAKTTDQSQGNKDQESGGIAKQKTQELQKKWRDTCLRLHPKFHHNNPSNKPALPSLSMASFANPNPGLLSRPPFQPKLLTTKPLGQALQLNTNTPTSQPAKPVNNSPPGSPVRTDLVLGRKEPEKINEDRVKDCISSEPQTRFLDKFAKVLDADTYKKLLKGLMEKAWWQAEAASAVASAVTRCRLGNGKHGAGNRGDIWLLFTGPDRVGKKKMASVLAEQIYGASPVSICLGSRRDDEDQETNFRGKTAIDRIAEAIRRNPSSVIILEDVDEADILVRGSIKRAIERGRLTDAHGREVGLGNAIFLLTGDWSTTSPQAIRDGLFVDEKRLASLASGNWQLGLIVREKSVKRRANWLEDEEDRQIRPRKEMCSGLSFDLNLSAETDLDRTDGSHNSSDLTIDHEDDLGLGNRHFSIASVPHDLASNVDDSIVFKPVDAAFVRREIKKTISVKFSMVADDNLSIEVEDDVVEKILGGLWHSQTSLGQWIEDVLAPSFDELKPQLPSESRTSRVVRLVVESESGNRGNGEWLPNRIIVES